jgi:Rieske Fe-S protein
MTKKGLTRRSFAQLAGGVAVGVVVASSCDDPVVPQEVAFEPTGADGGQEVPVQREPILDRREPVFREKGSEPAPEVMSPKQEPVLPEPMEKDAGEPVRDEWEPVSEEPVVEKVPELPSVDLDGRKYFSVDLNKEPGMAKVGWYINVNLPDGDIVYLFRKTKTTLSTVSGVCTHKGCFVGWRADQNRFLCPCHAATFTADGRVTGGPAPTDLKSYPTAWDAKTNTAYIFLDR